MNLKTVLATLLMPGLPVALFVLGVALTFRARTTGTHRFGLTLVSIPVGVALYAMVGVATAAARGAGHFYSVPFGGYRVDDAAMFGSMGIGVVIAWLGLNAIVRR